MTNKYCQYWAEGFQIHVHTNGDLAMELVLDIVERLGEEQPRPGPASSCMQCLSITLPSPCRPDHRTTIEHAGFFTEAQARRLARLGCLVSAQPYYHYVLADKYSELGSYLLRSVDTEHRVHWCRSGPGARHPHVSPGPAGAAGGQAGAPLGLHHGPRPGQLSRVTCVMSHVSRVTSISMIITRSRWCWPGALSTE